MQSSFETPTRFGDIIYDQPHNESVCEKRESVQCKVALAITGAIQGTSREKIYQELGLESLRARRWYKGLSCMVKIVKEEAPNYFINLIPKIQQTTRKRINGMPTFHCRADCFKNSFFSSTLSDWYKLDEIIETLSQFQYSKVGCCHSFVLSKAMYIIYLIL